MVKSLVELCTTVCLRNIKDIADLGDIPVYLARPIIMKVDNPVQLRHIEINSPHLAAETLECWKRLIARDFPVLSERHRFVPSNPKSWHKIYAKYQRLDSDAKRAAEEKLKNAYKEIKKEKDQTVSKVVTYDSRKLPRLPRDVKPQVGARPRGGRVGPDQSELRFTGGSRTKTSTPKSLLKRAIREANEISSRNRLNTMSNAGRARPGQIVQAPAGMVQEKINSARPLTGIRPPTRQLQPNARNREADDREARLRKAKEMDSQKGGSYLADEDLDDVDIEGDDGPIGLDIDDLEALDQREPAPTKSRPSGHSSNSGASSAKGSAFARKMSGSSVAPSTSRVHTEVSAKQTPPTKSSIWSPGPASPPPKPVPSSSSNPTGPGPMLPRKRKAVDVFMKPKPKVQRR